jgi:4-amino-4-deoxy-L-arabinose transferase-like glycosyltransferase
MLPRLSLPPSPATLALIALAFALPGLAGHDLWKTHDAIGLGIVHDMTISGAPLVPRVAGMPWLFDPPLYHWLAAGFGKAFQFFTEFHAGARLVSGAMVLAAFWLIYLAARDGAAEHEHPRTSGAAAMLALLGSVGLMVHAHEALPELGCLAALCGALAVLPHATRKPLPAGVAVRHRDRLRRAVGDLDRRRFAAGGGAARAPGVRGMAHAPRTRFSFSVRSR